MPPRSTWPDGSSPQGDNALRTPFPEGNDKRSIRLHIPDSPNLPYLVFVVYYPDRNRWDNNDGRNYVVKLSSEESVDINPLLDKALGKSDAPFRQIFPLDEAFQLGVAVIDRDDCREVILLTNLAVPLALHWGVAERSPREWRLPPEPCLPAGTTRFGDAAVETPFAWEGSINRLKLVFPKAEAPIGISFVLRETDPGRWRKNNGKNFFIPLNEQSKASGAASSALAEKIIEAETGHNSWTLMHRFNLCHDLLDSAGNDSLRLALLFVWLRFSALRQLDWQRNYNTKPRELAHSQDRLTRKLAETCINNPDTCEWLRLMMGSVGRGGEGQQIRDEILAIMHRHHIKEVSGHFLEEWHQKLHNNTTPDDVVICQAYINFLKSNGNLDVFHETLEAEGVTRERLKSFERPIVSFPDFVPHLKDGLIHDFSHFLKLLKSIHSGADLEVALENAAQQLDDGARDRLYRLRGELDNTNAPLAEVAGGITEVRGNLLERLSHESDSGRACNLLYLDIALEEALRMLIERNVHKSIDESAAISLLGLVLQNVAWSHRDDDLPVCVEDWRYWVKNAQSDPDLGLKQMAVLERIRRAVTTVMDRLYQSVQPLAEQLGSAFEAEDWTVNLFGEAVVRGRPVFALSALINRLDPILREKAGIGGWQIVSRGESHGKLEVVESLRSVQGKTYRNETILVADKVSGDEEPPPGVTGIITAQPVDLVSHLAVRARNVPVVFAICYEPETLKSLKDLKGKRIQLNATASGDVTFSESKEMAGAKSRSKKGTPVAIEKPKLSKEPIAGDAFRKCMVGGKALHLDALRNLLPDWINLPASAALPFGVFESVLNDSANRAILRKYEELSSDLDSRPEKKLVSIRELLLKLEAPKGLTDKLMAILEDTGIPMPSKGDRENAWNAVKQVWASKWNDRAFFSRRARSISDDAIHMAVLIQELVPFDYAFVLHTADPFTGREEDLYGELVKGLGETLVSNFPGRALSFRSPKSSPDPSVLAYPAKSVALTGKGWIFRSDSNAEDLSGYAGAGLYESVVVPPPETVRLKYSNDPLVTDSAFRESLLTRITKLGTAVEEAFKGVPQDIEGGVFEGRFYVVQSRPQV